MPFKYDVSDELEKTLSKLFKKDRKRYEITMKKIEEIASRDLTTIDFYKNLKYGFREYKRAHIDKSFVFIFKLSKEEKFILFDRFGHHDDIYRKKR